MHTENQILSVSTGLTLSRGGGGGGGRVSLFRQSMLHLSGRYGGKGRGRGKTNRKAIKDIEKRDKERSDGVDSEAPFPQMEGSHRHVFAASEQIGREREGVACTAEDNEGASEVSEGGLTAESDGAETGGEDARQDGGLDRTTQFGVGASEEFGEGDGVVAGESPPGSADGEECADQAGGEGEEDDEEEAEGGGARAGCLIVCLGQGEGAVAVLDGGEVADAVE